jgi:outer membrane protein assembly factor BamB
MSADLDEFFARARSTADTLELPPAREVRHRGDVRRQRRTAAVVCTTFAVVAGIIGVVGAVTATNGDNGPPAPASTTTAGPPPRGFGLNLMGTPITFGQQGQRLDVCTLIADRRAYVGWRDTVAGPLRVAAVDLGSGARIWTVSVAATAGSTGISVAGDVLLVQQGASLTTLDRADGHQVWTTSRRTLFVAGNTAVGVEGTDLVGRGLRDGNLRWRTAFSNEQAYPMGSGEALPRTFFGVLAATDPRIVVIHDDNPTVQILDSATGTRIGQPSNRPSGSVPALSQGDTIYFVSAPGTPLRIDMLRAGTISAGYRDTTTYQGTGLVPCFTGLLCFEEAGGTVVALDPSTWTVAWRTHLDRTTGIEPAGNLLLVNIGSDFGVMGFAVLDSTGRQLGRTTLGDVTPLAGSQGTLLRPATAGPVGEVDLLALSPTGQVGDLGNLRIGGTCAADQLYLICQTNTGFSYWTYRT